MATFDFTDYEETTGKYPVPGKCHMVVTDMEDRDGVWFMAAEICAHDKGEAEVGKVYYDYFYTASKAIRRAAKFAVACGIVSKEKLDAAIKEKKAIDIPFENVVGKEFLTELHWEEFNSKRKAKAGFTDFWAVDDKTRKEFPKDRGYARSVAERQGEAAEEQDVDKEVEEIPF